MSKVANTDQKTSDLTIRPDQASEVITLIQEPPAMKHFLLKTLGKLFDPLGFLSPFNIRFCFKFYVWKVQIR